MTSSLIQSSQSKYHSGGIWFKFFYEKNIVQGFFFMNKAYVIWKKCLIARNYETKDLGSLLI